MAEQSKIEWTDHTFNPWIGCQKVSPGCDNCYAEARDNWLHGGRHWGPHAPRHRTSNANWHKPIMWDRKAAERGIRYRVFCASLADVFDNQVPNTWRDDLWSLIDITPNLDWLLLTKRPENMRGQLPWTVTPWPNVWLGVSVEDQQRADHRIPILLDTPAALRWVSAEPLLGPVDFMAACGGEWSCEEGCGWRGSDVDALMSNSDGELFCPGCEAPVNDSIPLPLDWTIIGGESGPRARPFDIAWARSIIGQCKAAGVPVFMKQLGAKPQCSAGTKLAGIAERAGKTWGFWDDLSGRLCRVTGKADNPAQWPADLRVREFPKVAA